MSEKQKRNFLDVQGSILPKGESTAPGSGGAAVNRAFIVCAGSYLGRFGVGLRELIVAHGPDIFDAAAAAQKQTRRRDGDESHEKRVLDEILALFIGPEIRDEIHFDIRLAVSPIMARKDRRFKITAGYSTYGTCIF